MSCLIEILPLELFVSFPTFIVVSKGVFCGAMGLLFLFALTFYFRTKERIYLYYGLFVLFSMAVGIINLKYDLSAIQHPQPMDSFTTLLLESVTLLAFAFYCFFNNLLLGVKERNRYLYRFINIMAYIVIGYVAIYFIFFDFVKRYEDGFFIGSRIVIMTLALIAIIWVGLKINSTIKVFFNVGSIFYFLGALVGIIREVLPIIPFDDFYQFQPSFYFEVGILLETICFGLALGYRINALSKIKEEQIEGRRLQAEYEKNIAQAEMLATRMQVNPHFVSNSLSAINLLIQKSENKKASQYLVRLSRFFRMILELPKSQTISLTEELTLIEHYITLEAKRFDNEFNFEILMPSKETSANIQIPPLLLQPFVENAISHGLLPSDKENKNLFIKVENNASETHIVIEDNGVGRRHKRFSSSQKKPRKKSMGMKITQKRIEQFNQHFDKNIQLSILDKREATGAALGTKVILKVK